MGLFHEDEAPADPATGGPDGAFDVIGEDGQRVRYTPDDFDEIFTTADEHEARRRVTLGWLVLDEVVHREGYQPSLDAFWRRMAGRVLTAGSDPQQTPGHDVTTYVLGYLKPGGTRPA